MVSEKLMKRIEKLESDGVDELRITKRYIDGDDAVFDVATYIFKNVKSSFFVIECELKYSSSISSNIYDYSFEVQTINDNRITDFNLGKQLEKKLDNIIHDIGYANVIHLENQIKRIIIQK